MNKLNFGCGARFSAGWTNIDFHASDRNVHRVNLLAGFPFPDQHFDVVYSSHVLEHFSRGEGLFLMKEARRVLKPRGVIRLVVPDLEETAREYRRILDLPDSDLDKPRLYEWITIELLDQLVRSRPGGAMGAYIQRAVASGDSRLVTYISSRTETKRSIASPEAHDSPLSRKLGRLTWEKLCVRIVYWYLAAIKKLMPKRVRSLVVNNARIGECHRWMYDRYGITTLMQEAGFADVSFRRFNESVIADFNEDYLDSNPDGSAYKNVSIYCEAMNS